GRDTPRGPGKEHPKPVPKHRGNRGEDHAAAAADPHAEQLGAQNGEDHSQSRRSTAWFTPTSRTKASSRDSPLDRSSASVPLTTIRPSLMMATRSQRRSTTSST